MTEISGYTGPKTLIEVSVDGIVSKYYVPFSNDEVEALTRAREQRSDLWNIAKTLGSDDARKLYIDAPIPWAFSLENRTKALEKIRSSAEIYGKLLENENMARSLQGFRRIVEKIHKNLSSLLPKE